MVGDGAVHIDSEGRVFNTQRSTGGSYTGLDRMGLFDLLKPARASVTTFAPRPSATGRPHT